MNPAASATGNRWWLQPDSGRHERMNPQLPFVPSPCKSPPLFSQTLKRKSSSFEGKDGCQTETTGACRLDETDERFRWYMAEEKELALMILRSHAEPLENSDLPTPHQKRGFKDCMLETDSRKPALPTRFSSSDFEDPLSQSEISQSFLKEKHAKDFPDKNLDLLKALQLSQTRARLAERKAYLITMENENLLHLYFKDSARLFAYTQWVKLLELEIRQLHSQVDLSLSNDILGYTENFVETKLEPETNQITTDEAKRACYWAITLCLSLASIGVLLTWRRGWRFGGLCSDNLRRESSLSISGNGLPPSERKACCSCLINSISHLGKTVYSTKQH